MTSRAKFLVPCWLGIASAGLLMSPAAQADTTTTTFAVTATVLKACVVTANPLAFGTYDPTAATPLDGSTTLSVFCTVGSSFTIGLNTGTASGHDLETLGETIRANVLKNSGIRLHWEIKRLGRFRTGQDVQEFMGQLL